MSKGKALKKHWSDWIAVMSPCADALAWARKQKTPAAAWRACQRGDWMLWLVGRLSGEPESAGRKKLVLASCACARLSLKYVAQGETRPLAAIETAEKWARDDGVTLMQVRTAADAAYAADASAADAASAAYAAYAAAYAADYAADYADARSKTLAKCADIVRRFYPKPPCARNPAAQGEGR